MLNMSPPHWLMQNTNNYPGLWPKQHIIPQEHPLVQFQGMMSYKSESESHEDRQLKGPAMGHITVLLSSTASLLTSPYWYLISCPLHCQHMCPFCFNMFATLNHVYGDSF